VETRKQSVSFCFVCLFLTVYITGVVVLTTVRTPMDYFQQTQMTLTYASRAKKIKNRSLINRNIIGDTGIHAVSAEIERLQYVTDSQPDMHFCRFNCAVRIPGPDFRRQALNLNELGYSNCTIRKKMLH
jgi:hypothetical protein